MALARSWKVESQPLNQRSANSRLNQKTNCLLKGDPPPEEKLKLHDAPMVTMLMMTMKSLLFCLIWLELREDLSRRA